MNSRLIATLRHVLTHALSHASGGRIPQRPARGTPTVLSSGRRITDPDEAEALGLTADARRMRHKSDPRSST